MMQDVNLSRLPGKDGRRAADATRAADADAARAAGVHGCWREGLGRHIVGGAYRPRHLRCLGARLDFKGT